MIESRPLNELEGCTIGVDVFQWFRSSNFVNKEPLHSALGGLPITLEYQVFNELNKFYRRNIHPLFMFNGLKYADNARAPFSSSRSRKYAAKRKLAWKAMENNHIKKSIELFSQISGYVSTSAQDDLLRIFARWNQNIEFKNQKIAQINQKIIKQNQASKNNTANSNNNTNTSNNKNSKEKCKDSKDSKDQSGSMNSTTIQENSGNLQKNQVSCDKQERKESKNDETNKAQLLRYYEPISWMRAPYYAAAQLAFLESKEEMLHAVYGGCDLLMFGGETVILSIDFDKNCYDVAHLDQILYALSIENPFTFVDICLLSGFDACRTFEPLTSTSNVMSALNEANSKDNDKNTNKNNRNSRGRSMKRRNFSFECM